MLKILVLPIVPQVSESLLQVGSKVTDSVNPKIRKFRYHTIWNLIKYYHIYTHTNHGSHSNQIKYYASKVKKKT